VPELNEPILSVVVAIVSDTAGSADANHLEPCLTALRRQTDLPAGAIEIIVPFHPSVKGMELVRERHPDVRFCEVTDLKTYAGKGNSREHHDELRARGLALARGRIVALIEDHGIPAPDWGAAMIHAHRGSYAAFGGAIENGIDRPLNWAVYYCDFLRYQNPLPEGESYLVSDANVAYKRAALESVKTVWSVIFHESSVTAALRARGENLAFAPRAVVFQHRRGLRLESAMRERFVWGRSYGATRGLLAGTPRRLCWAVLSPVLPVLILARMALMANQKRRTRKAFLKAFPLTAVLIASWSCGEWTGYVTGRAHSGGSPAADAIAKGSRVAV
jgi:hypothetical protein